MKSYCHLILASLLCWACWSSAAVALTPEEEFFEQKVRPLLLDQCGKCHGSEKQQGNLRFDQRSSVFANPDHGPLVQPGKLGDSRLWQVVQHSPTDTQMPPDSKLSPEQLDILKLWIENGAVWPGADMVASDMSHGPPRKEDGSLDFGAAQQQHWAYRPISNPSVPEMASVPAEWNSIDRFIAARQQAAGVSFSPEADRRTLLRRLKFDLHGLAPTQAEADEFAASTSSKAYAELVDRLLAAPEYGQRWARHWLDVARYADTKGYVFTENRFYPNSFTYRDYVVDAFNSDKSYNRFVLEQLAADQLGLPEQDPALAAQGFLTAGPRFLNREPDIIDDRIDVVMRGFMAMTMGCARCHDHKYDPLPSADYYSLYGVFASSTEPELPPLVGNVDLNQPQFAAFNAELAKREQALQEYTDKTHAELLVELRRRAGDYLQAWLKRENKLPAGLEPIYEHGEPRDRLINRWKDVIADRARLGDKNLQLFQTLASLPAENYAAQALLKIDEAAQQAEHNPRLIAALRATPPQNVRDVAQAYGKLFAEVQNEWDTLLQSQPEAQALADAAAEELRRAVLGPGSLTDLPGGQRSPLFERDHGNKVRELRKNIQEWLVTAENAPPRAMALHDKERPEEPVVFVRGNPGRRGPQVPRRGPQILDPNPDSKFTQGSGRLELAQLIVSEQNPLTARVIVNRVWLHHFGVGLVNTPSDFGARGSTPTHPELLDHLAWRFMHDMNWSLKTLHREILLSHTYRQSSVDRPDCRALDADNALYWRQNRRRLDFEAMHDMLLQVAGKLDVSLGGRPVDLEKEPFSGRRAVYGLIDRNNLSGLLRTFDFPSPDVSNPQRPQTTVPQQSLYALNSPFVQQQAASLVERLGGGTGDPFEQARQLVTLAYARPAAEPEVQLLGNYLAAHPQGLKEVAQGLLMSNEFFFVD